ncbi:MAG: hypothetical protein KH452_09420 [Clostridiales bacterium]|nr:hypothetical protein [Clostridiales bacterium]
MKKYIVIIIANVCMLSMSGCQKTVSGSDVFSMPGEISKVEISGYYDGSVINAGDFVVENFNELATWLSNLSLQHRTFADGKTPSETQSGGDSYIFTINNDVLTFTYADGGTTEYIVYNEEWYEVLNPSELPFK